MALVGQVAIVTGASRGIGRGIALQLGQAGATVYVTGRKPQDSHSTKKNELSALEQVKQEIDERGGKAIVAYVNHGDMDEVKQFFELVDREQQGRLDILVNNVFSAVQAVGNVINKPFHELEPEMWDEVNNVGLRNHYFCSVYAARIMVKNNSGLIVHLSSAGGLKYIYNVAYGVGKCALDRMAADMAVELKKDKVTCVSIWPGAVRTEIVESWIDQTAGDGPKLFENVDFFKNGETVEYPGKAVVHLASDKKMLNKTGRIWITADMGDEYGFLDIDSRSPPNLRSVKFLLTHAGYKGAARWVPAWVKLPGWLIWASVSRL